MGYAGVHGKTQSGLLCIKASDDRKAAGYSMLAWILLEIFGVL